MRTPTPDQHLVICVSGGKDSTALALWLRFESGLPNRMHLVFCDTGHEHPFTIDHVHQLAERVGLPLNVASSGMSFIELCEKKGMFPAARSRFCTEELKVKPISEWMDEAYGDGRIENPVIVQGIRSDESPSRAKAPEWDDNRRPGQRRVFDCPVWRPILDWSASDVFAIHERHGFEPNPLYKLGARRVGCFPCVLSGKSDLRASFEIDGTLLERLREYERRVEKASSSGLATFKHRNDIPPSFWDLEQAASIDAVYKWAMGDENQGALDFGDPPSCWSHYGLCE